jgi:aryl-alcohol dehydrogenase-like predicted oxidoreductase
VSLNSPFSLSVPWAALRDKRRRSWPAELGSSRADKGVRPAQLAIAWALHKGETIVLVVGARTGAQIGESPGAATLELSAEDVARLERAVPAAADSRYAERQIGMLDSER